MSELLDKDGMRQVDKDFTFHEADPAAARTLTPEQVRAFNASGFLCPLPALSDVEMADVRGQFDRLLALFLEQGRNGYDINGYHIASRDIWALGTHPAITRYVTDILGPGVVMWGTHFFCKLPGDTRRVPWHQDNPYFSLAPSRTATVWLAIDRCDRENGCLRVIPGSHRRGFVSYESRPEEDGGTVLDKSIEDVSSLGEAFDIALRPGQVSVHSDLIVHSSEPNGSARRRAGLSIRYASMQVRSYGRERDLSTWVSGEDPTGHWSNLPCPSPGADILTTGDLDLPVLRPATR